jgi:putative thioredoxin
VATLREVPATDPLYSRAQGWVGMADFFRTAGDNAPTALAQQIGDNPNDLEARYQLAAHLARSRDYAAAITQLLAIVERDRAFRDDGARKTLLALFDALGAEDPLAAQGRRKLANLLF